MTTTTLKNGEFQQSNRDASINKAASPSYANQAFQLEEPDNSLKSDVSTKTKVSVKQRHTGPAPLLMKQAANKSTASSVVTANGETNVADEYAVIVDVGGGADTAAK
ncbi:hypothetical protein PoB_003728500 [Plakobranchus ocellatus]|uniref:Uncharacterized protein n=1 Tax=Plakobranchus ocellatus TaxID=259542 RepID=A0AAV4AR76_9GAST|nr:hypothetical protein PoB_003728500 [Plakobranchus ocellatus]